MPAVLLAAAESIGRRGFDLFPQAARRASVTSVRSSVTCYLH
jgi:hypothetical protein